MTYMSMRCTSNATQSSATFLGRESGRPVRFTSAQPVPHGVGMADQKITDPRIFESAVDLRFLSGAKGTRTPDPHTASVVRYQLRHSPRCRAHRSYTT
ncbi:MAG: hypothetical protein QOG95_2070, partial [Mycobacterium sp.]|nr:hypothetical protein [Mycobacterium sp.]